MIAPKPEHCWYEKTTASKFILYSNGGARHTKLPVGMFVAIKVTCAFLYSPRNSLALLFSQPGSFNCPPCIIAFLWLHIIHACTRKYSNSSLGNLLIKDLNKNLKSWQFAVHFCSEVMLPAHTSCAAPHSQTAWMEVSATLLQQWHLSSSNIFHFARLTLVGKIS